MRLFKTYVEAYVYAEDEVDAMDEGYLALHDKLACGIQEVEVEEVDEE